MSKCLTEGYIESYSPVTYMESVKDISKRKKYRDGFKQAIMLCKDRTVEGIEKLRRAFKDSECSMMSKTKESFVFKLHPIFSKNRARLIACGSDLQAAILLAYNSTALNFIMKFFKEHIPLGMNTTQMEEFFKKEFGTSIEDYMCDGDGSAFDSHQSSELMDSVDDPFHDIFIDYYLHLETKNIIRELNMPYDDLSIALVRDIVTRVVKRRLITLKA